MSNLLQAKNIYHSFDETHQGQLNVLNDISFNLKEGEILCILGSSGCGKTTLLNILTGLIVPTKGNVTSDIKRPSADIGYMTQDNPLLPWRSVLDNIALGLELHKCSKKEIESRSQSYLDMVRLSDFADSYPNTLSGGMRQRVALARTLALEPKLLLMDEPLSNLDIPERKRLSKLIKEYIKNKKAGAIIVTHSVEEAVFLADKILLLTPRPASVSHIFEKKEISYNSVMNAFFDFLSQDKKNAA